MSLMVKDRGAVDCSKCPSWGRGCRCKPVCRWCGYRKHTAIHGTVNHGKEGSKPYGHAFSPHRGATQTPYPPIVSKERQVQALRDAVAWAYQAIGARWPNAAALDNLSAALDGRVPPHEWPVVPPVEGVQ